MESLTFLLVLLGVVALAAVNLLVCTWLVGVWVSVRRERADKGLAPAVQRLREIVRERDAEVAALLEQQEDLKRRLRDCGLERHHRNGSHGSTARDG